MCITHNNPVPSVAQ